MNDLEKIKLLKDSLFEYKDKWEDDKNRLNYAIEHREYNSFDEAEKWEKLLFRKIQWYIWHNGLLTV